MSYEAIKENFTKERIHIIEIDVPRCINVHGSSPCTASETGNAKCYNTRTTCNDLENYNDQISATGTLSVSVSGTFTITGQNFITIGFAPGQIITTSDFTNAGNNSQFEILTVTALVITVKSNAGMVTETNGTRTITTTNLYTYRHCKNRSPHPINMNNYAPCVESVSVAPAKIDPKGGIGARTSANISFGDFPGSDRYDIDPYLSDRTYNPLEQGSYWTKFRIRNANYENYAIRILTGYIIDNTFSAVNFETRFYALSTLNATNGKASITAKDPLQLVSNKDALYPAPSRGQLSADLPLGNTSFTITPSGTGADYPTGGFYVKIRNEVILVNARSGDSFSSITRAQFNTEAVSHSADDTVQQCIEYDGTLRLDEVVKDILVNGARVPPIFIPIASWKAESELYLTSNPNRLLTDPTKVSKLIEQLSIEWPHQLYWNDRSRNIELNAIKIPEDDASYNTFNSDGQLMELSTRDRPDMQISTVFVRYGQFDPTKKQDETDNYSITYGRTNSDAIVRYDSNNAKVINALWISAFNGGQANKIAQIHGRRFGITPREVNFLLEDKDSSLWLGEIVNVNHFDICDQNGLPVNTPVQVLSASEGTGYEYNTLEYKYDALVPGVDLDVSVEAVLVSDDVNNINLLTLYTGVFGAPDGSTDAIVIVESGVIVGSTSTGTPAVNTGSWPSGATIKLEVRSGATVVGAGGAGGASLGADGSSGGNAILLNNDLEVINAGLIGGGGGGGGSAFEQDGSDDYNAGGGGGAGRISGAAGTMSTPFTGDFYPTTDSQPGTLTSGGNGGTIQRETLPLISLFGGDGGNLGQAGAAAIDGTTNGTGGAAGKAVKPNGNTLTLSNSGTVSGATS